MEVSREVVPEAPNTLPQVRREASKMSGWLKFLGVFYIIMGLPTLIVLVGAINIWLGVLLYQAGSAAKTATDEDLLVMMEKFKMYFIATAVLMLLFIAFVVLVFVLAGIGAFFSAGSEGISV